MLWFLEKITPATLPIYFSTQDQQAHPADFAKLIHHNILQPCANLAWVSYEYNHQAWLETITNNLGIKNPWNRYSDEGAYTPNALFKLGMYQLGRMKIPVFYLRTLDIYEPTIHFLAELASIPKILLTNIAKPILVYGKENTSFCSLLDILAHPRRKSLFSPRAFKSYLAKPRRVRFDKRQGHLFLDETLIYTAGLDSGEYYFLLFLWNHWQKQMPYHKINQFIVESLGREVADTAQKACHKLKSAIKQKYPAIDMLITSPTTGHYMLSDPRE